MRIRSIPDLVQALREYRLMPAAHLAELTPDLLARFSNPRQLAQYLVAKQWLTPFQAKWTWRGLGQRLVLGHYVLLERLGAGGMGQVYRARHSRLEHELAIKVIHRHLLADQTSIQRFHREIHAVGQLSHPNIVYAYDAGKIGGSYYLVMEFVEGVTLEALVQEYGPLPLELAYSYVRQAALGLQHAHVRSLIHRDIKPANLVVTRPRPGAALEAERRSLYGPAWLSAASRLKILDMGLARWQTTGSCEATSLQLTQVGMILGTLDFVAPEQAQNSRAADNRSDLYALGCTFYYLLAGDVPFPSKHPVDKLMAHQMDEPRPLEWQRPELPSSIISIIRRLMAKAPADRYLSAAALIRDLDQEMRRQESALPVAAASSPKFRVAAANAVTVPTHRSLRTSQLADLPGT
jgi:serine/threonine-protein kinase